MHAKFSKACAQRAQASETPPTPTHGFPQQRATCKPHRTDRGHDVYRVAPSRSSKLLHETSSPPPNPHTILRSRSRNQLPSTCPPKTATNVVWNCGRTGYWFTDSAPRHPCASTCTTTTARITVRFQSRSLLSSKGSSLLNKRKCTACSGATPERVRCGWSIGLR